MLHPVDRPIITLSEAIDAKRFARRLPEGEQLEDRLIEMVAFRLAEFWQQQATLPHPLPCLTYIVKFPRIQLIDEIHGHRRHKRRSHGSLTDQHYATYQAMTYRRLLGSMRLGNHFRKAMSDRFEEPFRHYRWAKWMAPSLSHSAAVVLDQMMCPAHRTR